VLGIQFGYLLGGAIVIGASLRAAGMGRLGFQAVFDAITRPQGSPLRAPGRVLRRST